MQSRAVRRRFRHSRARVLWRLDGHLRAENGKIAWDMDTKGDYQAVNGVGAKGGSIDGGGAVVVDGTVYVGSGSGFIGTAPGNVLLAYSVDAL
jgi:polyvinyl alcohol dehydrogenase (cytochrome)